MHPQQFQVPPLRCLAKQALPNVIQGLVPLVVFYAAMWALDIWAAIVASLAWAWGAVAFRLARGKRVPGMLFLGAAALTARTIVAMASDSVFVYFLQPTLVAALLAIAFLLSVPAGRPLATRLAADVVPMPDWFHSHPAIRRFFARVTLMWGVVQLANAGITAWLLLNQPVEIYLAAKTIVTGAIIGVAAFASLVWFRRVAQTSHVAEPVPTPALAA